MRTRSVAALAIVGAAVFYLGRVGGQAVPSGVFHPGNRDWPSFRVGEQLPDPAAVTDSVNAALPRATQGHFVVYLLFSLQCGKCLGEAIAWEELHSDLGERVRFVGLAAESSSEEIMRFRRLAHVSFPIFEGTAEGMKRLGVHQYPTIYVVDKSRTILFAQAGAGATPDLQTWIAKQELPPDGAHQSTGDIAKPRPHQAGGAVASAEK